MPTIAGYRCSVCGSVKEADISTSPRQARRLARECEALGTPSPKYNWGDLLADGLLMIGNPVIVLAGNDNGKKHTVMYPVHRRKDVSGQDWIRYYFLGEKSLERLVSEVLTDQPS